MYCLISYENDRNILLYCFIILTVSIVSGGYALPPYLSENDQLYKDTNKYCGAYAIWHTLYLFGITPSINSIIDDLQIDHRDGCSLNDIRVFLTNKGISCRAVKLNMDNIEKVNNPFIQYNLTDKQITSGHFCLIIPTNKGKAIMMDGVKKPIEFDISFYKYNEPKDTSWDGSAIIIDENHSRELPIVMTFVIIICVVCSYAIWLNRTKPLTKSR